MAGGVEGEDEATKRHVDRCGDEGRGGEEEEVLEDPGADEIWFVGGPGAAVVAKDLGC